LLQLLQLLQLLSSHQLQQSNTKAGNSKSTQTTPNRSRRRAASNKGVVVAAATTAALPTPAVTTTKFKPREVSKNSKNLFCNLNLQLRRVAAATVETALPQHHAITTSKIKQNSQSQIKKQSKNYYITSKYARTFNLKGLSSDHALYL
jgi:hypothetical protein